MNRSISRLLLRLGIPVIALTALGLAGEPIPAAEPDPAMLAQIAELPACVPGEETPDDERSHMATRLRWAITLPALSRPVSLTLP